MRRSCLLFLLFFPAAAPQNRDTLETLVTASGGVVLLEWSQKHPWKDQLAGGLALVAEYQTPSGRRVSEVLATARPRHQNRSHRFPLPAAITAPPQGPVCLFFQLPNRRILPLRRANRQGDETARFRLEAWESAAAYHAGESFRRQQIQAAEQALAVKQRDIQAQQHLIRKAGWLATNNCRDVTPPPAQTARPFDAIDPDQHDAVARLVCIRRVWNAESRLDRLRPQAQGGDRDSFARYIGLATRTVRSPLVTAPIADALQETADALPAGAAGRVDQARQFRADWDKWSARAANYNRPHFGEPDDVLYLQSGAAESGRRIFYPLILKQMGVSPQPPALPPAAQDFLGYLGASVEAYTRCVADGRKQLQAKFESWVTLRDKVPELQQLAHADILRACQRDLALLARLQSEAESLQQQLAQLRNVPPSPPPAPASSGAAQLNFAACELAPPHLVTPNRESRSNPPSAQSKPARAQ